ncbi:MAG: ASCH domain-containing protein, partial [Clostridia bacterium]
NLIKKGDKMKALSIKPNFADSIACKQKTVEFRTWKTDYRGDILICSSSSGRNCFVRGYAICVANLKSIEVYERKKHFKQLYCDCSPSKPGYAWILDNIRIIEPVPVKGKLHIYDVDIKIQYVNITNEDELIEYWEGLNLIN